MTRARIAALALMLSVALAGAAQAQQRVTRSAQLDADGEFRIWNPAGSVHVIGWDLDSVRVEGELDDAARESFVFGAEGEGGKLSTEDEGRSGRADLVVRLPRGATVWVKTMSANVVVNGVNGAIDVYAVTGNVTIASPAAASVYAESMGGRVHVTGLATDVRLRTGSGSIQFSGRTPDLSVRTVSGPVLVRVAGLMRGLVESVDGRVHLGVSFGRGAQLEVLTHAGAIDLTLPARTPVEWLVSTVSGGIRVLDPLRRAERTRDGGGLFGAGRGGRDVPRSVEGGAEVVLRTFSGDITLRGAE